MADMQNRSECVSVRGTRQESARDARRRLEVARRLRVEHAAAIEHPDLHAQAPGVAARPELRAWRTSRCTGRRPRLEVRRLPRRLLHGERHERRGIRRRRRRGRRIHGGRCRRLQDCDLVQEPGRAVGDTREGIRRITALADHHRHDADDRVGAGRRSRDGRRAAVPVAGRGGRPGSDPQNIEPGSYLEVSVIAGSSSCRSGWRDRASSGATWRWSSGSCAPAGHEHGVPVLVGPALVARRDDGHRGRRRRLRELQQRHVAAMRIRIPVGRDRHGADPEHLAPARVAQVGQARRDDVGADGQRAQCATVSTTLGATSAPVQCIAIPLPTAPRQTSRIRNTPAPRAVRRSPRRPAARWSRTTSRATPSIAARIADVGTPLRLRSVSRAGSRRSWTVAMP